MNLKLSEKSDRKQLKDLYNSAFPKEERMPFRLLWKKPRRGADATFLTAEEEGRFLGLVYLIVYEDLAYLNYLAVTEKERGKGYGTEILKRVKEQFPGHRVFLAREDLDPAADNYDERVRRQAFYARAGFEDLTSKLTEAGVTYEMMSIGGGVTSGDYDRLIDAWIDPLRRRMIGMYVTEKEG